MTKRKPVAPFYAAAAVWVCYALFLPLYQGIHFVLAAGASILAFAVAGALCKGSIGGTAAAQTSGEKTQDKPKEESTGNEALDKMLKDGRLAIAEMKRLDDNIADPGISADIVRLEQVSQKIFDEVRRSPDKLPRSASSWITICPLPSSSSTPTTV